MNVLPKWTVSWHSFCPLLPSRGRGVYSKCVKRLENLRHTVIISVNLSGYLINSSIIRSVLLGKINILNRHNINYKFSLMKNQIAYSSPFLQQNIHKLQYIFPQNICRLSFTPQLIFKVKANCHSWVEKRVRFLKIALSLHKFFGCHWPNMSL